MHSCGCRSPGTFNVDECKDVKVQKCLFTRIKISVGITMPFGGIGLFVNYRICFGNATCKKGVISVFGNPGTLPKDLPISSDHFYVWEDYVRMIINNFIQDLNFMPSVLVLFLQF